MVGWHHWLDGHAFEQAPRVGDGQRSLSCCNLWGRKESDMTEWLDWTELKALVTCKPSDFQEFFSSTDSFQKWVKEALTSPFVALNLSFHLPILYEMVNSGFNLYLCDNYLWWTFRCAVYSCCGFPGASVGEESTCQWRSHRRLGFHPWMGKIPWRGKWQPTPEFLPEKFHGQRSLAGYSPWGHKNLDRT